MQEMQRISSLKPVALKFPTINLQLRNYPPARLLTPEIIAMVDSFNRRRQVLIAQVDAQLASSHKALRDTIAAATQLTSKEGN